MSDLLPLSVSVVTPSLNQGRFIGRTLQSVADQGPVVGEHYVVDGGSTDATVALLQAAPGPVRWLSEADGGQADAVNKAIAGTGGDIIAWINSDDIYYPGAIARVVRYFAEHPEVDVVYGCADHIDEHDAVIAPYPVEPFALERLYQTCFICQPAAFFRRRCIATHGALDERLHFCMDYEFWLRLARGGARFAFLPERLAGSRFYADTKTLRSRPAVHREIITMFLRMLGRVPDRWLWGYASVCVAERYDRQRQPLRFALAAAAATLVAALRWNRGVSPAMMKALLARAGEPLLRRWRLRHGK